MRQGTICLPQLSCVGRTKRLPLGKNIHIDSQKSPRTLAEDVIISAKITSEKYIGSPNAENMHLPIALIISQVRICHDQAKMMYLHEESVSFALISKPEGGY